MSGKLVVTIFSFKFYNERIPSGEELSKTHLVFILSLEMCATGDFLGLLLNALLLQTYFTRTAVKNYS